MSKPTSWETYHKKILRVNEVVHPKLNIFATRYALAKNFPDFQFNNFSKSTSDAYHVSLKVSLAYTALESLESALGCSNEITIISPGLLSIFQSELFDDFFAAIFQAKEVEKKEKEKLKLLLSGKNEDLRPIAFAIRNLMFHGSLTAKSLNLTNSMKRRGALNSLSISILDCTDKRFSRYVLKIR